LRRYLKPHLLILNDFAMRDFTPQQSEDLYELVGERVRAGSTITTSNRGPNDWYPLFPNPVLAEGILDRLLNSAHQIFMSGRSYRPQQRPDRGQRGVDGAVAPENGVDPENRTATTASDAREEEAETNETLATTRKEVIANRHSRSTLLTPGTITLLRGPAGRSGCLRAPRGRSHSGACRPAARRRP